MTGAQLEAAVREIARGLWNLGNRHIGPVMIGSDEIYCICRTEEIVHIIECTVESKMDKTRQDVNKLVGAKRIEEKNGSTVKLWLITEKEPTGQQWEYAQGQGVTISSLDDFRNRLIDARSYLEYRWSYTFGSARDLGSESVNVADDEYISVGIHDGSNGHQLNIKGLCDRLLGGTIVVLRGPYGSGKSLTTKEVFRDLRGRFFKNGSGLVPVAINLRDHWGSETYEEVLRRHASRIGFEKADQLVRAWHAGRLVVLLDGFDELAAPILSSGREAVKHARRQALACVRSFVNSARPGGGILITGRDNYFGSDDEMHESLGLPNTALILELGEFSDVEARRYLRKKGLPEDLPSWLPRKPLLLGYLIARGLLAEALSIDGSTGPAYAWNQLLDRISEREAKLPDVASGNVVRRILEALATRCRSLPSLNGPLYERDIDSVYEDVSGVPANENARLMLQRLPGLTSRDQEDGSRSFVDKDLLDALQGSSVGHFIKNPYATQSALANVRNSLGLLGQSVAAVVASDEGHSATEHRIAAEVAALTMHETTLAVDCVISGALRTAPKEFNCDGLEFTGANIQLIDFETMPLVNARFHDCHFNVVDLADISQISDIQITNSTIARIVGITGLVSLPDWIVNSLVDEYDSAFTTAAILRLQVPLSIRVMLTIFRKLFLQPGGGRLESALRRGLDQQGQALVPSLLALLEGDGMVYSTQASSEKIWHARSNARQVALDMLGKEGAGVSPLLTKVREL